MSIQSFIEISETLKDFMMGMDGFDELGFFGS